MTKYRLIAAFDNNIDSILTGKGHKDTTWHAIDNSDSILFDKNLSESDDDIIINKIQNE